MEKGSVELQHVISFFTAFFSHALMGDVGPPVQFMLKHLKLAGVDCTPAHMPCMPCDLTRSGGFSPEAGAVVLCQGNFLNKKHMEHTLVHELLHMYDHAVFNVDWSNLRYHACSEVCLLVLHPSVYYYLYIYKDPCEQFEWRLLLGTRNPAWEIHLLKAAPGARGSGTVYMLVLILPASGVCPKTRSVIGHG